MLLRSQLSPHIVNRFDLHTRCAARCLRMSMLRSLSFSPIRNVVSSAAVFSRRFSLDCKPHQDFPYFPPPDPPPIEEPDAETAGTAKFHSRRVIQGSYEEEQVRVLQAAIRHVVRLGWTSDALIAGATDAGISPSFISSFPRRDAALVEYFMDNCLQKLYDKVDSGELPLENLILSDRLTKLIRARLEMQKSYLPRWPQALSIQAKPINVPTSFKQRATLVDKIWQLAGDYTLDMEWYVKRTVLGGIYSTTEVYMLTDHSPEFHDTWTFLDQRIKDAFDLQKSIKEATNLAQAIGSGIGNSLQGFMKGLF